MMDKRTDDLLKAYGIQRKRIEELEGLLEEIEEKCKGRYGEDIWVNANTIAAIAARRRMSDGKS